MISNKINALLSLNNVSRTEISKALGISPQAFSNKLNRQSFNDKSLKTIANYCGYDLAFIDTKNENNKIII